MRENQLPVHYTSAEEAGRVRPALDSGDGGVNIPREPVAHLEPRTAGNDPAEGSSNSVHISLSHFSVASASAASNVAVDPRALPGPPNQSLAHDPECSTKLDEARDSKLGMWLLAFAAIFVYAVCNPDWVHSGAQTDKISKPPSDGIKRSASTALGGTDVIDTAKAGAHPTLASDWDETVTDENSRRPTSNGDRNAGSNAGGFGAGGEMLPALSPQAKPITKNPMSNINQGFNEGVTVPVAEMPKVAGAKTSKPKKGFLVPPPPPTPCVLPPADDLFPMQTAQQYPALQQQLHQAQAQASAKTHNQSAAREDTLQQPTAASGGIEAAPSAALADADRAEATQSAALAAADKQLQAAVRSSLRTAGQWAR